MTYRIEKASPDAQPIAAEIKPALDDERCRVYFRMGEPGTIYPASPGQRRSIARAIVALA